MSQAIHSAVSDLMRSYLRASEARIARLIASGIPIEDIGIVTYANCQACRGAGYIFTSEGFNEARDGYQMSLSSCPLCPGITVTRSAA